MLTMKLPRALAISRTPRLFDPHQTPRLESLAGRPLATFRQRLAAFVIDFLVVLIVYIPVEITRQYLELKATHHPIKIAVNFSFHELADLAYFIVYAGLTVWCTNGLTLGKRLLHIRIISLEHPKITLWQAVERALGYGASALEGGFGFIQYFIHINCQCVHDRIAETIVVQDRPASADGEVVPQRPRS
jgi:uncharacterized RDD family membrane protein YckC